MGETPAAATTGTGAPLCDLCHVNRLTRRADYVKPRLVDPNPRCSVCKSEDPHGRAPMFHPAHKWTPCWVTMPGGDECGCTVGVQQQQQKHGSA